MLDAVVNGIDFNISALILIESFENMAAANEFLRTRGSDKGASKETEKVNFIFC